MDDDALAARIAPLFRPKEVLIPRNLGARAAARRRHRRVVAGIATAAIGLVALLGVVGEASGGRRSGVGMAAPGAESRRLPSGDTLLVRNAGRVTIRIEVAGVQVLGPAGLGPWAYPNAFPVQRAGELLAVTGALITWTGTKGVVVVTVVPGAGAAFVQARVGEQHDRVVASAGRVAVLVVELPTFQPGWPSPTGSVAVDALDPGGHALATVIGALGLRCPPPGFNPNVTPASLPRSHAANQPPPPPNAGPPPDFNPLFETTRCRR